MAVFLASIIQRCPFAVPVKRYGVRALVDIVQLLEIVVLYTSRTLLIKQAECNLIFCVWLRKKIIEYRPVSKCDPSGLSPISDLEEDRILLSPDFMLSNEKLLALKHTKIPHALSSISSSQAQRCRPLT